MVHACTRGSGGLATLDDNMAPDVTMFFEKDIIFRVQGSQAHTPILQGLSTFNIGYEGIDIANYCSIFRLVDEFSRQNSHVYAPTNIRHARTS